MKQEYSNNSGFDNSHITWNSSEVTSIEREMLLENLNYINSKPVSNWIKGLLTVLAVLIPGIGQIFGLVVGMLFVSDKVKEKRFFGMVLIAVSVVMFSILLFLWLKWR
ncbi:hypothetical protein [Ruminiclostridium cellulolyticum]|uniref:Uncharacterized protein n=1 Tax=Ruminiclostridium cellulolyticum (strain ATCC 35319 / DSM 5812 / JCM 6584 / H10) TaxID=394503 RepID=B8I474_RUMCH|nr:hypothetical protein [Ruminiclostridium cellulolyticum]ACL76507.1 hypothetical protein Ccel_2165 [Ruminiclostridium cellulolyticum H10]